jgi:hypothetical protein
MDKPGHNNMPHPAHSHSAAAWWPTALGGPKAAEVAQPTGEPFRPAWSCVARRV